MGRDPKRDLSLSSALLLRVQDLSLHEIARLEHPRGSLSSVCWHINNSGSEETLAQYFIFLLPVPPLIRIQNQHVAVENQSIARLSCEVEAYPEALKYWERADGRLIEASDRHHIANLDKGKYKVSQPIEK